MAGGVTWLNGLKDRDVCQSQVGVNYDPMIAKLIAKGPDRATALANLHKGLSELQVGSQAPTRNAFLRRTSALVSAATPPAR